MRKAHIGRDALEQRAPHTDIVRSERGHSLSSCLFSGKMVVKKKNTMRRSIKPSAQAFAWQSFLMAFSASMTTNEPNNALVYQKQ